MVLELTAVLGAVVTAAGRPVPQTDPAVLLGEGDSDRAPMVCPIMVVLPDSWI